MITIGEGGCSCKSGAPELTGWVPVHYDENCKAHNFPKPTK